MGDITGSRKLVVLTLSPTEFFVKGEGSESDIRNVIQHVLPNAEFTLSALSDSDASAMQSRLKPPQQEIIKNLHAQEAKQPHKAYRVQFKTPPPLRTPDELTEPELEAVTGGGLTFNPQITLINKPLINPGGPVSVTVGVGIAGKF